MTDVSPPATDGQGSPRRGRGRPRLDGRRLPSSQLVELAGMLFAERGFDGFTMAELARRAGVDRAVPYYHFDSKLGVLQAYGASVLSPLIQVATAPRQEPRPDVRLAGYLGAELAILIPVGSNIVSLFGADWLRSDVHSALWERLAELDAILQGWLSEGAAEGSLAAAPVEGSAFLTSATLGALASGSAARADDVRVVDPHRAVAHVEFVLRALGATPEGHHEAAIRAGIRRGSALRG